MAVSDRPTDISLSPSALDQLYSRPLSIIASTCFAPLVRELAGPHAAVVAVDGTGLHKGQAEETPNGDAIKVSGVPSGLELLILKSADAPVLEAWLALYRGTGAKKEPLFLLLEEDRSDRIAPFLLGHFRGALQQSRDACLALEQEVLSLRGQAESLRLDVNRLERQLKIAGQSLSLAAHLAPGEALIGPSAELDTDAVTQPLPVMLSRLAAVKLYCGREGSDGSIIVSVHQPGGSDPLFTTVVKGESIKKGWFGIELKDAFPLSEGELRISWTGAQPPLLALADVEADGFAAEGSDRSLAMQLFKHVAGGARKPVIVGINALQLDIVGAARQGEFVGGEAALENAKARLGGSAIVARKDWLQTHPLPQKEGEDFLATAIRLPGIVPASAASLTLRVGLAHPAGHPLFAGALVVPAGTDLTQKGLARRIESNEGHGFCSLTGGELSAFDVSVPPSSKAQDLILYARPQGASTAFGQCRWYGATTQFDAGEGTLLPMPQNAHLRQDMELHALAVPITSLIGNIGYWAGSEKMAQLVKDHNVQAFVLSGAGGYLQVHPVAGEVSAAVAPYFLRSGALAVGVNIRTAHENAPEFLYGLCAIDASLEGWRAEFEALYASLDNNTPSLGEAAGGALQYCTRVLTAGMQDRLTLPLGEDGRAWHLVFFTKPVGANAAFGWCRFDDIALYFEGDQKLAE